MSPTIAIIVVDNTHSHRTHSAAHVIILQQRLLYSLKLKFTWQHRIEKSEIFSSEFMNVHNNTNPETNESAKITMDVN